MREALFSQDGWGGDNVKQDNAWDADGKSGNPTVPAQDASQVSYNIIAKLNLYLSDYTNAHSSTAGNHYQFLSGNR